MNSPEGWSRLRKLFANRVQMRHIRRSYTGPLYLLWTRDWTSLRVRWPPVPRMYGCYLTLQTIISSTSDNHMFTRPFTLLLKSLLHHRLTSYENSYLPQPTSHSPHVTLASAVKVFSNSDTLIYHTSFTDLPLGTYRSQPYTLFDVIHLGLSIPPYSITFYEVSVTI